MIELIKKVDQYVGWFVCKILGGSFSSINSNPEAVAFIQLWGVGESLLTLPAIKQYSEKHPSAYITVICTARNKQVYECHEFIDSVVECPMNPLSILTFIKDNYKDHDVVYDFEEYLNISSIIAYFIGKQSIGFLHGARARLYDQRVFYDDQKYVAEVFCDLVGVKLESLVKLEPISAEREEARKFLKDHNLKEPVLLFPWTAESAPWRAWPVLNWKSLISSTPEDFVVVCGPLDDPTSFQGVPKFQGNLFELAALIEESKCFISNDTGPMHLSVIMGCRTICLFGPNIPARWAPQDKKHTIIFHKQSCCPCIDSRTGKMTKCENDAQCMKEISIDEVRKAI